VQLFTHIYQLKLIPPTGYIIVFVVILNKIARFAGKLTGLKSEALGI